MTLSRIALASAALALGSTAIAQTPVARPCLSSLEAETLVSFALPAFVQGLARKCSARLPSGAYLTTSAPALAARYRREASVPWSKVEPVLRKVAGEQLPRGLGNEFGVPLAEAVLTAALVEQVNLADCQPASRIVEAMAPLPATNTARLAAVLLEFAMKDEKAAQLPFRMCPAGEVPRR